DSDEPQNVALIIVGENIAQLSKQIMQRFLEIIGGQRNDAVLDSSDTKLRVIAQTFWDAKSEPVSLEDLLEHIALTALDI
ncbi:MAG: hypothetical protein ACFFBD_13610, partial [Candidatus Hodarchaeota archaeon]